MEKQVSKQVRKQFVDLLGDTSNRGTWIPRAYVLALGGYDISAVFSALLFWSKHGKRQDGLFWKSDKELGDELGIEPHRVRYHREKLVEQGLFTKVLKRAQGSPTNHYRPNYGPILDLLIDVVDSQSDAWNEMEFLYDRYVSQG